MTIVEPAGYNPNVVFYFYFIIWKLLYTYSFPRTHTVHMLNMKVNGRASDSHAQNLKFNSSLLQVGLEKMPAGNLVDQIVLTEII